ncbi:MAG: V0D/AC39 family V-type ATPase subunit [Nitrosopumilaceae archaeon]
MHHKIFGSVKSFSAHGRLLSRGELQTLAESRNLDELVTRIKSTVYVNAVSKLAKPITAEKIESALRSHLADMHHSLAKAMGGSEVLNAYYPKFIIWNLHKKRL